MVQNMTKRFFTSSNKPDGIIPEDYAKAHHYIEAIKSIVQIAYESIYVIDYVAQNFLYVSPNPLLLCGLTPEEVMELGYGFYITHVPENELRLLLKINAVGFQFFNRQPKEERHLFSISYDFHIVNNGESVLINHKLTPLAMDGNGHMWLGVCYVSISNNDCAGNIQVRKSGQSTYWCYEPEIDRWIVKEGIKLTDREKEVLMLSARGLTVEEIAMRVHRSKDSIKSRRRTIFEKLGVSSISEAIAFAVNYKLI